MTGRTLTTTTAVIDALGGNQAVQALTGAASRQTVSNWRRFKAFPSNTHAVLSAALIAIGKEAPRELWGQVGPKRMRQLKHMGLRIGPRSKPRKRKQVSRSKDAAREGARSSV
jgi:hypothetical protein